MDEVHGQPWTRKHENPEVPTVPAAPTTLFPKTLEELIEFRDNHPRRSYWSAFIQSLDRREKAGEIASRLSGETSPYLSG